jgi:hypothetical protein
MTDIDALIDDLTQSLEPAPASSLAGARVAVVGAAGVTVAAALLLLGIRPDLANAQPEGVPLLSAGLFLLAALSCGLAATRMAKPAVGNANSGWRWAVAAMALLPLVALVQGLLFPSLRLGLSLADGIGCLARGVLAGTAVAAVLTVWLRRGAPVRIHQACWLVGLSAGAVGAVAVALTCPDGDLSHIGLWHSAIVLAGGGISRLALPRLLRW